VLTAALIVALLGNRGFRSLVKNYMEYRRLEHSQRELKTEQVSLEEKLKKARTGEFVEQAARKELGLARAGEYEYRFPPPGEDDR